MSTERVLSALDVPARFGAPARRETYTYGVDREIVRAGAGSYYHEHLCGYAGSLSYEWRSSAAGEESAARGVLRPTRDAG